MKRSKSTIDDDAGDATDLQRIDRSTTMDGCQFADDEVDVDVDEGCFKFRVSTRRLDNWMIGTVDDMEG